MTDNLTCPFCHSKQTECLLVIDQRPPLETNFNIPADQYKRSYHLCHDCEIYFAHHDYDFEELYRGNYNNSTYSNQLASTYEKIMSLPEGNSDNVLRCERIDQKLKSLGFTPTETQILDIGSGLSVFLGKMKTYGYSGYAIDPDQDSVNHAVDYIKIEGGFCGDIHDFNPNKKFPVLCMNKVLEHVKDPLELLNTSLTHLDLNGVCYLELPDGPRAHKNGGIFEREEFYIEHYYCFSEKSFNKLMQDAGLKDIEIHAIFEPSGKYTLYGFGRKT